MQIHGHRKFKNINEAEKLELIKIEGDDLLSIVVSRIDESFFVVSLPNVANQDISLRSFREDTVCMSYCKDWMIVPREGEESYPSQHSPSNRTGLLALAENGWWLSHRPVRDYRGTELGWLNVETAELARYRPNPAAYFTTWEIWLDPEETKPPLGSPLLKVTVENSNSTS